MTSRVVTWHARWHHTPPATAGYIGIARLEASHSTPRGITHHQQQQATGAHQQGINVKIKAACVIRVLRHSPHRDRPHPHSPAGARSERLRVSPSMRGARRGRNPAQLHRHGWPGAIARLERIGYQISDISHLEEESCLYLEVHTSTASTWMARCVSPTCGESGVCVCVCVVVCGMWWFH